MPRLIRSLVAGATLTALLLGMAPAVADESASAVAQDPQSVLPTDVQVPPSTQDVTTTDVNLRSTNHEVSVLLDQGAGSPTVHKLRTETQAQADQLAADLSAMPGVVAAPTTRLRAFGFDNTEPMGSSQWNLPAVGIPDAWRTTQGAGVVVAVIDSGVDATHPDLIGRVLPALDLLPAHQAAPEQSGHGTRVAGIIAAAMNGIGIAGVAPKASILPALALDPEGNGDSTTVARAIIAAADAGARVINLSLGGPDKDPVLDRACAYAFLKGAVIVAAAGNTYASGNAVQYPAASPKVLGVASVDRAGNRSAFSNTGHHIDIAAPGEEILAPYVGNEHNTDSGTSFAAPHVAGTLALVLAANPRLTAAQAASAVVSTALDDASGDGRDDLLGQGIVRADRAVVKAKSISISAPAADATLRLRGLDASPEPALRGVATTFTVTVQAQYPDGKWRATPTPTRVRFEFKRSGRAKYRVVRVVTSGADGRAVMQARVSHSGRWRAQVKQANGRWTPSNVDFLGVRR